MGWAVGYDENWKRDIGYGVPCTCDHPDCDKQIHRGIAYVCGGEPYGGDRGCGLFFCGDHLLSSMRHAQRCECCAKRQKPFVPKPDVTEWLQHKLTDETWQQWRDENADEVARIKAALTDRLSSSAGGS